ncbi:hypothetical protein PR048_023258 [Dryococelus australis]|uniref:Uncharacterized protein n=1 Tax=Dryococelus australis TaxID=614101 RepID=A0ABQ9GTM1_9NEOP|nr:hypothetical protein PR048_023258 [Dryococelus australis]
MVSHFSTTILGKNPGDSTTYTSINTICNYVQSVHFPLCNGTSLRVVALQKKSKIEANILTGCGKDDTVKKKFQFSFSKCFTMTINKSQGQTLGRAGVYLIQSCSTHMDLTLALLLRSGAAPYSPHCTLIESQDLVEYYQDG